MSIRREAIDVVLLSEKSGRFIDHVLANRLCESSDDPRDKGLLMELVYGSIRHRLTLDTVLSSYTTRPLAQSPRFVVEALRQATYQCFFLDRVPVAAAVNEAVTIVRERLGEPVARFANAVLRRVTGTARRLGSPESETDPRVVLAVRDGKSFAFDRPIFADPAGDLGLHLAQTLSYPPWLLRRWLARFGPDETRDLGLAQNHTPLLALRVQPLRGTLEALMASLRDAGIEAEPLDSPGLLRVRSRVPVESLPGFEAGCFTVQDRNAARVVPLLDPRPGESVLDLCAAPGGKATQIAEHQADRGRVVAVDASEARLRLVEENARRLGLRSIELLAIDGREVGARFPGQFDKVLVDAPCSNTGVLARRPEARWRAGEESLASIVTLQRELLDSAARAVRPGGTLVYSTCSLEPEENAGGIADFMRRHAEFERRNGFELLPHRHDGDGAFASRLERVLRDQDRDPILGQPGPGEGH